MKLSEVRQAVADYMSSEGCSCCEATLSHDKHKARLAKLLRVPKFGDNSGYEFSKFTTKAALEVK